MVATILCVLLAFPLAYVIAFKAGRYKNLILGLVILPFFVTFLIRTLAWKTILADDGWVVSALGAIGLLPDEGRLLSTSWAVIGGLTYNWIIFMILPLYVSLEKIDPRLLEASKDLYSIDTPRVPEGDPAAVDARRAGGQHAGLHPRRRRLHQRRLSGQHPDHDDRQRHPETVPRGQGLSRPPRR